MRVPTLLPFAALLLAAPLAAQDGHDDDHSAAGHEMAHAAELPAGWQLRLDKAEENAADVSFRAMEPGWHVTTGPAAILWSPDVEASGAYRVEAKIHLMRPSEHPEGFGVILGGSNLSGDDQDYLYFLIRQDGRYLVKHRAGAETHTVIPWTESEAVIVGSEDGSVANTLAVEVTDTEMAFFVNDQEVQRIPRPEYARLDGVVGLRVNHKLDVHVESLAVAPLGGE
ncbi:MAG TPA: hypothetical protein VML95_01000 [Longimicrobiales bacterium]|nr:hypothetical protein [Longimicrobiales bacterium]